MFSMTVQIHHINKEDEGIEGKLRGTDIEAMKGVVDEEK